MTAPLTIRRLSTQSADFYAQLDALLAFDDSTDEAIERAVAEILANVRKTGDAAVLDCTRRFDQLDAASVAALELPKASLAAAFEGLPQIQKEALQTAAQRIRIYLERQ